MGREVRKVPKSWEHPKDEDGDYIPLFDCGFQENLALWEEEKKDWQVNPEDDCSYEEWAGFSPVKSDYMPDWNDNELTHYQMYEDTTEGTPISPVLSSPEDLAKWLVDNKASAFAGQTASYESWLRVCRGGFACSAVIIDNVLTSGVDGIQ